MRSPYDKPLPYHEAAEHKSVTLTGWVCRSCGRLYPDDGKANGLDVGSGAHIEHLARWCCSRQTPCRDEGCTVLAESPYTACDVHRKRREAERRAKAPRKPWGPDSMLCLDGNEHFCADPDEVEDRLYDEGVTLAEAVAEGRITLCAPNYAREFVFSEHIGDDLPDDGDVPEDPDVSAAVDALNKALDALGPVSWCETSTPWDGTTKAVAPRSGGESP